jgi:hypothetical protein
MWLVGAAGSGATHGQPGSKVQPGWPALLLAAAVQSLSGCSQLADVKSKVHGAAGAALTGRAGQPATEAAGTAVVRVTSSVAGRARQQRRARARARQGLTHPGLRHGAVPPAFEAEPPTASSYKPAFDGTGSKRQAT